LKFKTQDKDICSKKLSLQRKKIVRVIITVTNNGMDGKRANGQGLKSELE